MLEDPRLFTSYDIILKMTIDKHLFLCLFLSFIGATVVGTLSHEVGHYVVAESLGYDAQIHYGAMGVVQSPFDGRPSDGFWITFGGPLQTMLTGSLGLLLIFLYRERFRGAESLAVWQWLMVFIALFWLRQTANLTTWIGGYLWRGSWSGRGDEIRLAKDLGIPEWTLLSFTGLIGLFVLALVVFKIIPARKRWTFILAGFFGGVTGYILWLYVLGRIVLP